MIRVIACAWLGALIACGGYAPASAEIAATDLLFRLGADDAPLVLDVRTPAEYVDGHVPGAVNVPHDQVAARVAEIRESGGDEVVVYCESGRRAGIAAQALESAGLRVVALTGHMSAWRAAGHPTERGGRGTR